MAGRPNRITPGAAAASAAESWIKQDTCVDFSAVSDTDLKGGSTFAVGGATWNYRGVGTQPASFEVSSGKLVITAAGGLSSAGGISGSSKNTGLVYATISDLCGGSYTRGKTGLAIVSHMTQTAPDTRTSSGPLFGVFAESAISQTGWRCKFLLNYYSSSTSTRPLFCRRLLDTTDGNSTTDPGATRQLSHMMVIQGGEINFFYMATYDANKGPDNGGWVAIDNQFSVDTTTVGATSVHDIDGGSIIGFGGWQPPASYGGTPNPATFEFYNIDVYTRGL